MTADGLFHALIADPDVSARYGSGGMLQKLLNKHDVMPVVVVDVCGVPLAERVGADVFVAEHIADFLSCFCTA